MKSISIISIPIVAPYTPNSKLGGFSDCFSFLESKESLYRIEVLPTPESPRKKIMTSDDLLIGIGYAFPFNGGYYKYSFFVSLASELSIVLDVI